LRVAKVARHAVIDGERTVDVAALGGHLGHEELEDRIGRGRALVRLDRVGGLVGRLIVGEGHGNACDHRRGQRAAPPRPELHEPSPAGAETAAAVMPMIERFDTL
jgi:hypothetical protein